MVFLVGAGPGDPGLLTRRGAELLGEADVVIHDGLVHRALVALAPATAERIYAGKKRAPDGVPLEQDDIHALLIDRARAGKRVIRLKGGDPFVFGRGAEECSALARAGIAFEVVPGVSAATAVTAYAGIPLTARGVSSSVVFATGHEAAGKPSTAVDWAALARAGTVVLFMAWRTLADCCEQLVAAGRSAETPAAAIYWGTTPAQRTVTATLADLPRAVAVAGLEPPLLVVVGEVVALRETLAWYETRPLFGARVLITRPLAQAQPFAREISRLGGEPVILPVTEIAAVAGSARGDLDRAITRLGQHDDAGYDWVLFSSASAVEHFFTALHAAGHDSRAFGRARIACVGPATARAIAEHGLRPDVVPAESSGAGVAAALLAAASWQTASPSLRVLFPRAAEGRDEAVDALRAAGCEIDVPATYVTRMTARSDPRLSRGLGLLAAGQIDMAVFFAPSQVDALITLLGDDVSSLRACPVIAAIGNTTRAALTGRGFDVHVVPDRPDIEVLARELARAREQHPGRRDRGHD